MEQASVTIKSQELRVTWSEPFHGVTHSSTPSRKSYATIVDRGSFAELSLYYPGCGFRPTKAQHDNVADAKVEALLWLQRKETL